MLAVPCTLETKPSMASKKNGTKLKEGIPVPALSKAGGRARAEKLSPEQRSAIAAKAARAKWSKRPGNDG